MANTAGTLDRGHPVAAAAAQVEDILKTVRDAPAWSMSQGEARETMVGLTRLEAQLVELQARVAAHGQTIEVEADAAALASEAHEPVRVALADGRLLVDQAEVVIHAVEALPEVDEGTRARAQETLISCTAQGCDAPPAMTHAHHDQSWSDGGTTSVKNSRLLCGYHHARAHDPAYTMTKLPEGKVRFHRRT